MRRQLCRHVRGGKYDILSLPVYLQSGFSWHKVLWSKVKEVSGHADAKGNGFFQDAGVEKTQTLLVAFGR